jgi:hypothetical protein
LVKGVFDVFDGVDEHGNPTRLLKCTVCENYGSKSHKSPGILIPDEEYSQLPGCNQPRWFINLKKTLLIHINREYHLKLVCEHNTMEVLNNDKRKQVLQTIRYLSYFALKSNMPFEQYPTLLSTVNR